MNADQRREARKARRRARIARRAIEVELARQRYHERRAARGAHNIQRLVAAAQPENRKAYREQKESSPTEEAT